MSGSTRVGQLAQLQLAKRFSPPN